MKRFTLDYTRQTWAYKAPFRISGYVIDAVDAVQVTLSDGQFSGRGEAAGVYYLNEGVDQIIACLEQKRDTLERCSSREELLHILPPGGARNAVDCAMWDYEARSGHVGVARLAGIDRCEPKITTFTLSADPAETLVAALGEFPSTQAIKIKLDGDFAADRARVDAVRRACPDSWIGVDANQGYRAAGLGDLIAMLTDAGVSLLEQPVGRGREAELDGLKATFAIAADESILCLAELEEKARYFDAVNIKLDKCGGLTAGLRMAHRARELGLSVMVGNMGGSTLALAPAFILAQYCDLVDLDSPIFLKHDPHAAEIYSTGMIDISPDIWGGEAYHTDQRP